MATKKTDTIRAQVGPFAMVPVWLLDRCQDSRAIHLYAVLGRYANRERRAWPKREQLAADMQLSVKSIERTIQVLRDIGALSTTRRHRADGSVIGLDYLLAQINPADDQSDTGDVLDGDHQSDTAVAQVESHQSDRGVAQVDTNQSDTGDVQGSHHSDTGVRTIATPVSQQEERTRSIQPDPSTKDLSTAAPPTSPPKSLVDAYHDAFVGRFQTKPAVNGAKDAKLLKRLADSHGDPRVRELLTWFFQTRDPFIRQTGYTVGVFFSVFNKLLLTCPAAEWDGDAERQALMRDIRARAERREAELEQEVRAALVRVDPGAHEALKRLIEQQFTRDYPALMLERGAYERAVKGGMVRHVLELCAGGRSVSDVVEQFARGHAA